MPWAIPPFYFYELNSNLVPNITALSSASNITGYRKIIVVAEKHVYNNSNSYSYPSCSISSGTGTVSTLRTIATRIAIGTYAVNIAYRIFSVEVSSESISLSVGNADTNAIFGVK